jgi:hypothetical protein
VDGLKYLNDEYVDIMNRFPGEFVPSANAHALEEACRPVVEEMIRHGGAKAISVASSYSDGANHVFLDSPEAEWLWEFAEANDIVVHIHPTMQSIGHESLMQYRLNEAVGRPFDSACIEDAQIIEKILQHLGLDATPAGEALPRAPPGRAVRWPAASYASFQRIDPGFCHRCHRRFDRRESNAQKKPAA